jgi:hypothetical protein
MARHFIKPASRFARSAALITVLSFATLFFALTVQSTQAQEVGVRFGDIVGNNVAVDAVWGGKSARIHLDVSFGDGVGVELPFEWVRPLGGEAFNYYLGVGPYAWLGDPFTLGAVGEVGLEYHFKDVPLALGVDWRPALRIIDDTDFIWGRFGLNIRFVF